LGFETNQRREKILVASIDFAFQDFIQLLFFSFTSK